MLNTIEETNPHINEFLSGRKIDTGFNFDVSFLSERQIIKSRIETTLSVLKGKKVLHIGCADHIESIEKKMKSGNHVQMLLEKKCAMCIGIDNNEQAINYLKKQYGISNIIYADVLDPHFQNEEVFSNTWDYILLGEVLEHINNPVFFLEQLKKKFKSCVRKILISVPNAYGQVTIQAYKSRKIEFINSDHRFWFSPYTLAKVMHQSGISLDKIIVADPPPPNIYYRVMNKLLMKMNINTVYPVGCQKGHLSTTLIGIGRLDNFADIPNKSTH